MLHVYCTEKSLFIGLFNLQLILSDLLILHMVCGYARMQNVIQITYSKELTQLISNSTIHSGEWGEKLLIKNWIKNLLFKGLAWLCLNSVFLCVMRNICTFSFLVGEQKLEPNKEK